jgi:hypothetical protein
LEFPKPRFVVRVPPLDAPGKERGEDCHGVDASQEGSSKPFAVGVQVVCTLQTCPCGVFQQEFPDAVVHRAVYVLSVLGELIKPPKPNLLYSVFDVVVMNLKHPLGRTGQVTQLSIMFKNKSCNVLNAAGRCQLGDTFAPSLALGIAPLLLPLVPASIAKSRPLLGSFRRLVG